jgi:hypothetical protein
MTYTVVIEHKGEVARLEYSTHQEAEQVRQSFVNYGLYQEVRIEAAEASLGNNHDTQTDTGQV